MKLGIEDRVALVVGASRGIGFAIADTLAAEGANVAMAARGARRDQSGCGQDRPRRLVPCRRRHRSRRRARSLVSDVEKQLGKIDILICNVGSGTSVPPGAGNRAGVVARHEHQPVRHDQHDRGRETDDEPRQWRPR